MRVSAKSIVLEILSAGPLLYGPRVSVRQLVKAAAVFGVAENNVRVAIVRLRGEGLVDSRERGHYEIGPAADSVNDTISTWRIKPTLIVPWDGSWIGAFTGHLSRTDRPALRRRSRALRMLGFKELRAGLHVRPNNLMEGVEPICTQLRLLGLEDEAPVARLSDLDDDTDAEARGLWNAAALEGVFADLCDQLTTSMARVRSIPLEDAVRESFQLSREAVRAFVLDPLLPEPLFPRDKRQEAFELACAYQDLAIDLWREYLAPEDD